MIFTSGEVTSENHPESPNEWQEIGIHGNPFIILFLTRYFMPC